MKAVYRLINALKQGRTIANAARTFESLNEEQRRLVSQGKAHLLAKKKHYERPIRERKVDVITGIKY